MMLTGTPIPQSNEEDIQVGPKELSTLFTGLLISLVTVVSFGFWWGVQDGIYRANVIGPKAACETIRWSFYDCSKFNE